MNVFNKVTLESLKKNRTRTIVTIIGIMLSAAMICASTTLVSSMQNFVLRCAIHIDGDWYGAVYDAAYKDYEDIRDSDRVSSAAYAQVLGYAKIDSANERKPYLYVLGGDAASGYFETMPVHLILGTLPKDSTEINIHFLLLAGGLMAMLGAFYLWSNGLFLSFILALLLCPAFLAGFSLILLEKRHQFTVPDCLSCNQYYLQA